ncbi:MAG: MoxR family ATPase [Spirochaetales bacterium]|nr:MoxR family ATPase [Spirochaetales bacterium]
METTINSSKLEAIKNNILSVIYMDEIKLEYLLAALVAGGHVMLADTHGVGKTSLARALAGSIEWDTLEKTEEGIEIDHFNRVQCTVDLLPQDILGYSRISGTGFEMSFTKGPVFAHFLLCDEINLLTPKTQGSFFQVMEEQSVSIEGNTYHLPSPFFIISTMNLKGAHLFPLPAPQLDRFMLRLSLGYPQAEDELAIVSQHGRNDGWKTLKPVLKASDLRAWQEEVDTVSIHPDIIRYIVDLVRATREHGSVETGCSPRTGVKLSRMARSLALIRGEEFITHDHIKEIFVAATAHRLELKDPDASAEDVLNEILQTTAVPVVSS